MLVCRIGATISELWVASDDMIYLLTAIGLPPGGSSTVHIYTQTIHRPTQLRHRKTQLKHRTTQFNIEQHI